MPAFKNTAAQGEITIRRISKLPDGVKEMTPENGVFVVGHSETGHDHVMTMDRAKFFEAANPPAGMRILYALLDAPKELIHRREFDTHQPISHEPGIYEYRIGREYDPYAEIARRQAD